MDHHANSHHYQILIPDQTLSRAADYLQLLTTDPQKMGRYLQQHLTLDELNNLTALDLLGKLFDTKQPQIFAESAVSGNGSDWNLTELGLLGDVSVAVPVTIFDDGKHHAPTPHARPFSGTLVFTPGALLNNGKNNTAADWNEVTVNRQLSPEGYYRLYRRRLLPVFEFINTHATNTRPAFVTVPGLGCGVFAGPFSGSLGSALETALHRLLTEYGHNWPNIKAVYFDPYKECDNKNAKIHGIEFRVRPLIKPGNQHRSQLCLPQVYAEPEDDFSDCVLYSIVAWDHVSWPGNDFHIDSRTTDDGVKAAATDVLAVLTGVQGNYSKNSGTYQPPVPYSNWAEVVADQCRNANLRLWNPKAIWRTIKSPS